MNFDSVEVSTGGFEQKFINPGVELVKFTAVSSGAAASGTNFIELTTENEAGLTNQTRFYFAAGKNAEISAQALFNFVSATNGVEKDAAKKMIGDFDSYEHLATKLSSILVGRTFAALYKGEYVANKDVTKDSWIKANLSSIVTTKDKLSTLTFDKSKHITGTFVKGVSGDVTSQQAKDDFQKEINQPVANW